MRWQHSLFRARKPVAAPAVYTCTDDRHIGGCACFADRTIACIGDCMMCDCHECHGFRLARVRYWSWLYLERDYDRHVARQAAWRRRLQSADETDVDVTLEYPEIDVVMEVA